MKRYDALGTAVARGLVEALRPDLPFEEGREALFIEHYAVPPDRHKWGERSWAEEDIHVWRAYLGVHRFQYAAKLPVELEAIERETWRMLLIREEAKARAVIRMQAERLCPEMLVTHGERSAATLY